MLGRDSREKLAIAHLAFVKGHARIESAAMTASEVVEHDNLLASRAQKLSRHAPDIACTARNKNRHSYSPLAKSFLTPARNRRQDIRWRSFRGDT